MSKQYGITYDDCGNVSVNSGWVLSQGMPDIRVGPANGGRLGKTMLGDLPAVEAGGETYLGGSGRNLVVSGFPAASDHNGIWRHGYVGKWSRAPLMLIQLTGGSTTITDGTDTLAQRASGGPLGTLASTAYGEAQLGAAFTVTVAAEWSAPGVIPRADMVSTARGLQPMDFTATDVAHYTAVQDPRFTIDVAEGGEASMRFSGVVIAIRADGPNDSAEGQYDSTPAGLEWNPADPQDDDDEYVEPPAVNPFGVLTIVYSWPSVPHLDTGTRFLGRQVGTSYSGSPYMTWSGDNTSPAGSETVVVDLAAAWAAGEITTSADVDCIADWYPTGSYGPASMSANYFLPGFTPLAITIQPGQYSGGARTVVASLRIHADGSVGRYFEPWTTTLTRRRVLPPAGVMYVQEISVGGVFSSMAGPAFTPTRPADTAAAYCIPLATSDGEGGVEQIWSGPILRR